MEIETDSRESESGEDSESEEDSNSTEVDNELPEMERRFMTYNPPARHHNNRVEEGVESEVEEDDEISLIAERQFIDGSEATV